MLSPLAPIVVSVTLRAMPSGAVRVFAAPVTLTVPPLTALNAGLRTGQKGVNGLHPAKTKSPPENVTVPLSLLSRLIPVPPLPVTEPVNRTSPGLPVLRLVTSTVRPEKLLIVPA